MLRVQSLDTGYGRIVALHGVSVHVELGEVVALVGANGSGKSTLLRAVAGFLPAYRGQILLDGAPVPSGAPDRIVRRGVALVPEGRQLFAPMTVADNLILGAYARIRSRAVSRRDAVAETEEIFDLFPALRGRRNQLAGTLSGGEQQMVAIGRALMGRPTLLMLDEPSMGLAPKVTREIFQVLSRLRELGKGILLVEQNAVMALELADRGYVLETGRIVIEGPSGDLLRNPEVRRAYLGRDYGRIWER